MYKMPENHINTSRYVMVTMKSRIDIQYSKINIYFRSLPEKRRYTAYHRAITVPDRMFGLCSAARPPRGDARLSEAGRGRGEGGAGPGQRGVARGHSRQCDLGRYIRMPDMCGDQANKGVSRDGECIGLILDTIISRSIVICIFKNIIIYYF